jgi:hypothetical protein
MLRSAVTYLLAVACSGNTITTPVGSASRGVISNTAEPAAPTLPSCVSRDDTQARYFADQVSIAGDAEVKLCSGHAGAGRSCWRVDVAARSATPTAVTPESDPATDMFLHEPRAKATVHDDGSIELCPASGTPCRPFANPGPPRQPEWVAVSPDLATVAIPDDQVLRIYDVARGTRTGTIKAWPSSMQAGFRTEAIFVAPDRLMAFVADGPVSDGARVFDRAGKELADIGPQDFTTNVPIWHVAGTEWALADLDGYRIVVVDVAHPTNQLVYQLDQSLRDPKDDHDMISIVGVGGTRGRLVVVTGDNPPLIGVLDRKTGKLETIIHLPVCP